MNEWSPTLVGKIKGLMGYVVKFMHEDDDEFKSAILFDTFETPEDVRFGVTHVDGVSFVKYDDVVSVNGDIVVVSDSEEVPTEPEDVRSAVIAREQVVLTDYKSGSISLVVELAPSTLDTCFCAASVYQEKIFLIKYEDVARFDGYVLYVSNLEWD